MKRVLITRPPTQAKEFGRLVEAAGMEPVYLSVIEIGPPPDIEAVDEALRRLDEYDWVILTSANGVESVWDRMRALGIRDFPVELKVAAIGPKTAAALESRGVLPNFVPEEYVAEAILPGLGSLKGLKVLLLRADIARKALPEAIQEGGGQADEVAVYSTLPLHPAPNDLEALQKGVDWITFTSPSTVHNFTAIVKAAGLDPFHLPGDPLIACIGPITTAAAVSLGYPVSVTAENYTTEGLLQAIQEKTI